MIFMLDAMGYETGVDFEKLLAAAKYERQIIDGNYSGHQVNIGGPCEN